MHRIIMAMGMGHMPTRSQEQRRDGEIVRCVVETI